jgi:isopentenyl-diphosphate Delta-isomerase
MDHYQRKLYLAKIDKNDKIIGKIERWQAHKEGILHRGFTVILSYKNKFVLQHRRHLIFDKYFDLSYSSHPIYKDNKLQTDLEAIYEALKREWNIGKEELTDKPRFLDKFYYQAKDPNSIFTEHEIDYIYQAELKNIPTPNPEFSYDFSLLDKNKTLNSQFVTINFNLVPWVKKIVDFI